MLTYTMFINGKNVESVSKKTRNILNPSNGEIIGSVPEAQVEDVELAVTAAREAFDKGIWKKTSALDRGKLLFRVAELIKRDFDSLVDLEVANNGKPKREAIFDVNDVINCFEYYGGMATKIVGEHVPVPANSNSYIVKEPIGVCAQIIPWNYPFLMSAWKIAPALAAGNTLVLKPSELTPLTALKLAQLFHEAGCPNGVVNILTGDGQIAGNALVSHKKIDKIAFTGGTVTGKKIMEIASKNLKKVTLELGGKNPVLVFDDCYFDQMIDWVAFAAFANQGQVCSAGSRIYIEEKMYDKFVNAFVEKVKKIKVGNGFDESNTMGTLISSAHREKVEQYIQVGKQEGATLLLGGDRPQGLEFDKGYFLNPTIFGNVKQSMRIAREEIFGPVVSLLKFKTEEEAVEYANDSEYGLAAGIFTSDLSRANRILPQLRSGIVWANWYHPTFNELPWGGYKQSGIGRELGKYGLDAYLETKQININIDTHSENWY